MKKTVFIFNVDNVIDIITNSSSELFVLKADSAEIVKELLESVYPDYRSEYDEPKQIKDLGAYGLDSYLDWINGWDNVKSRCEVYEGFTFEEMYEPTPYPNQWDKEAKFVLRKSFVEENFDAIVNAIDPSGKTWLLYSIDDNPNWEMQEKLENIAQRYHLG